MSPTLDAFLRSWPFDPWLWLTLLVPAGIYLRGWIILHGRDAKRWSSGQLVAFLGGLASVFLALGSPIEPFAGLLLQVHMVQHLLLMMAAPALVWLGEPLLPLLRGLPRPIRTVWIAPLFRSTLLRRFFAWLTHPLRALPLFTAVTWLWHLPAAYDLALRSPGWHYLQHGCFLAAGLLFWYPVVRPYPARPRWSLWLLAPYLILVDVQNTVLSALLTFSDRVLYPWYEAVPRLGGLSCLEDQSSAGVIMWVPGSAVFLLPLFAIGLRLLSSPDSVRTHPLTPQPPLPRRGEGEKDLWLPLSPSWERGLGGEGSSSSDSERKPPARWRTPLPLVTLAPRSPVPPSRWDLLRVPAVGAFCAGGTPDF